MGFSLLLTPENRDVGKKLGLATLLMFTAPILTFYIAQQYLFRHKADPDSWAGGAAIIMTNVVVAGYCYSAYIEDLDETKENDNKQKLLHDNDVSAPRVGIYKQRTD
ncbi:hypothetical protein ACA910_001818 [Epithemia clementina (nom. ined.)]